MYDLLQIPTFEHKTLIPTFYNIIYRIKYEILVKITFKLFKYYTFRIYITKH